MNCGWGFTGQIAQDLETTHKWHVESLAQDYYARCWRFVVRREHWESSMHLSFAVTFVAMEGCPGGYKEVARWLNMMMDRKAQEAPDAT